MDNVSPENFEARQKVEQRAEGREQSRDVNREQREQTDYQAASMLEEPKNGSFLTALQLFAAWVKSVVADDKDDVV